MKKRRDFVVLTLALVLVGRASTQKCPASSNFDIMFKTFNRDEQAPLDLIFVVDAMTSPADFNAAVRLVQSVVDYLRTVRGLRILPAGARVALVCDGTTVYDGVTVNATQACQLDGVVASTLEYQGPASTDALLGGLSAALDLLRRRTRPADAVVWIVTQGPSSTSSNLSSIKTVDQTLRGTNGVTVITTGVGNDGCCKNIVVLQSLSTNSDCYACNSTLFDYISPNIQPGKWLKSKSSKYYAMSIISTRNLTSAKKSRRLDG